MTGRENKVCEKYSKRDSEGLVHCFECPLRVGTGDYDFRCKQNSFYNRHTKEWEYEEGAE